MDCCVGNCRTHLGKWFVPNGLTLDQIIICEYCIKKNKCFPADDVYEVKEELGTEDICGATCGCPKDHPRMKVNFCVGKTRVNYGTWFTPYGKTARECTYCEYCVDNKCVDSSNLHDGGSVSRCNCDCPLVDKHEPIIPLICEACRTDNDDKIFNCSTGECKNCRNDTPNSCIKYCDGCSYLLKRCCYCTKPVPVSGSSSKN